MIAKYDINPDDFYFASKPHCQGKSKEKHGQWLKRSLCRICTYASETRRNIFLKTREPGVDIKAERNLRVLDNMERVFKRERNVTHEKGLFYGRKQRDHETFEKFHAELSAVAGRCDFTNVAENVRDIFITNMRESDCQRKLSRSTKTPEGVYRTALSYECGHRAYISYSVKPASSAP